MSEDQEAQENELLALASIYDEEEFHRANTAQGGEIQLCLELPPDFKVVVKGTMDRPCYLSGNGSSPWSLWPLFGFIGIVSVSPVEIMFYTLAVMVHVDA